MGFALSYNAVCVDCPGLPNPYWVMQHCLTTVLFWATLILTCVMAFLPRWITSHFGLCWRGVDNCCNPLVFSSYLDSRLRLCFASSSLLSCSRRCSSRGIPNSVRNNTVYDCLGHVRPLVWLWSEPTTTRIIAHNQSFSILFFSFVPHLHMSTWSTFLGQNAPSDDFYI